MIPEHARRERSTGAWWVTLAACLAALVGIMAGLRFGGRSWLAAISPHATRLLDGHVVTYEAGFHFPLLLAVSRTAVDAPYGQMQSHDYRIWLLVYLASAIYSWTGSTFWAYALVDLVGWWLGALATAGIGLRLGASRREAAVGAVLAALSPAGAGWMWTHTLHVAASTAIAPLAWLGMAALAARFPAGVARRGSAVAILLLAGSLTYQHHVLLWPLLLAYAWLAGGRDRRGRVLSVLLGGVVFAGLTVSLHWMLARQGTGLVASDNDPVNFLSDALQRSAAAARSDGWLAGLLYLPARGPSALAACYGLAAALLGVGGLLVAAGTPRLRRLAWLGTLGVLFGTAEVAMVPRVYVALECFPFVALASAVLLCRLWSHGARWISEGGATASPQRSPLRRMAGAVSYLLAAAGAVAAVAGTNGDLWRNYAFAMRWFGATWR